jgi:hypothetical protein
VPNRITSLCISFHVLMGDQLRLQMAGLQQPPGVGLPGGLPPVPFCPRCAAASALPTTRSQHACARSWHYGRCLLHAWRHRSTMSAWADVQAGCCSPGARAWRVWRRRRCCLHAGLALSAAAAGGRRAPLQRPAGQSVCAHAAEPPPVSSAWPGLLDCIAWEEHAALATSSRGCTCREKTADWGGAVPAGWRKWQLFRPPTRWPVTALSRCCMQTPVWYVFVHIKVSHMYVVPRFS